MEDATNIIAKFDLSDVQRKNLARAGKLVVPYLDTVLDAFYDFAQADEESAKFFPTEALLAHARGAQKRHWEMLLSGDFPPEYFRSTEAIGKVHFRIQLPFDLYLAGYARATSDIQKLLNKRFGPAVLPGSQQRLLELLGVLNRVFALDTSFVIEAYFAAQSQEQEIAFDHITKGIERVSARDLSMKIPGPQESDYPERYDGVRRTFNGLMDSLSETIGTLQTSTNTLSKSAISIAESTQDLSQRTETQAATLEETAAAVEQITSSMKSSSDATKETSEVSAKAQTFAEQGNAVVSTAVHKMKEIAESSHKMSQIIGVIDDISFQTNLLALNAGVEAARAGEAGRGFAVVASEVRALAQRAATSAKEIKDLISVSVGHVEDGVKLVNEAGASLDQIVGDVKRVTELATDVSSSAREQFTGLSEINTGVSQLDSVTQQNAAMVEDTTAASRTMQQDAAELASLVSTFKISRETYTAFDAAYAQDAEWRTG